MSKEKPTFDPSDLPDESRLHSRAEGDFWLMEQGLTPDQIAEGRKRIAEAKKIAAEGRFRTYEDDVREFGDFLNE